MARSAGRWRRSTCAASASLPGAHNHQNACAAYAAARSLGLGPKAIEEGLATYPGLPHRAQTIATWRGVRIVNDFEGDQRRRRREGARSSFERVRWIAGGRPKAGGIEPLRPLFPRVAKAYLIGEAAEAFAATLGATPHVVSGTLEAAVAAALAEAEPGDTVLLAPACASFDQFASFEARGEAFEALVRARM